ncbi:MAG: hypothetical protein ABEH77_07965 [Halobacteriaceae archaeon]
MFGADSTQAESEESDNAEEADGIDMTQMECYSLRFRPPDQQGGWLAVGDPVKDAEAAQELWSKWRELRREGDLPPGKYALFAQTGAEYQSPPRLLKAVREMTVKEWEYSRSGSSSSTSFSSVSVGDHDELAKQVLDNTYGRTDRGLGQGLESFVQSDRK